jgi:hypothetical protein
MLRRRSQKATTLLNAAGSRQFERTHPQDHRSVCSMMNNVLARAEQQIINTARPVALAIITSSSAGLDSARRIIAVVYPPTIPSSNIHSPQQQHPPSPTAAAAVIVAAVRVCVTGEDEEIAAAVGDWLIVMSV